MYFSLSNCINPHNTLNINCVIYLNNKSVGKVKCTNKTTISIDFYYCYNELQCTTKIDK